MNYVPEITVFPWVKIIERYRKEGESYRQFNARIGCNHAALQAWKKGILPSQETINKIRDKLNMSFEDYRDLSWVCHNIVVADIERHDIGQEEETLSASNLPWSFLCRRLISIKEKGQTTRSFIKELTISPQRWKEMLKEKSPRLEMTEFYSIIRHPKLNNDKDLLEKILWGSDSPPLPELVSDKKSNRA